MISVIQRGILVPIILRRVLECIDLVISFASFLPFVSTLLKCICLVVISFLLTFSSTIAINSLYWNLGSLWLWDNWGVASGGRGACGDGGLCALAAGAGA